MQDDATPPDRVTPNKGGDHLLARLPNAERADARQLGFTGKGGIKGKRGPKRKTLPDNWRELVYIVFSRGGSIKDLRLAFERNGCSLDRTTLTKRAQKGELHDLIEKARARYVGFLRDPLIAVAIDPSRTDREAVELRKWLLARADSDFNINRPTMFNKTVIDARSVTVQRALPEDQWSKLVAALPKPV